MMARVRAASDRAGRLLWLTAAGVSLGFGAWALHRNAGSRDPQLWLFVLLVVVVVLFSTAALFALSALARIGGRRQVLARIIGSLVMGLAIVLMPAVAITAFSLALVGLALDATLFDRRGEQAETLLRDAVENFSEGFVIYDRDDRLVMCNKAHRKMHTESGDLSGSRDALRRHRVA